MIFALPFPEISPELFSFSIGDFTFALRWYALAYIVGILLGWWIIRRAVSKPDLWPANQPPVSRAQIEDLVTWIILGIIIGGRLGFVLFYQPAHFLENPADILKVWQGGMSFHGGFLGVVLALVGFSRLKGVPLGSLSDSLAIAAPAGIMLGRLANFVNAELWGRPTDLPWGVVFPGEWAQYCPEVEGICARHPSQLYEAALEGLVLGLLLLWLAFRRGGLKRPWAMTGVFFTGYGLARFAVEFVRVADAQFIFGDPGDRLVCGDWGVVDGIGTPGLFRPGNTTVYLRYTNTQGVADHEFVWGETGWLPVAGRFG